MSHVNTHRPVCMFCSFSHSKELYCWSANIQFSLSDPLTQPCHKKHICRIKGIDYLKWLWKMNHWMWMYRIILFQVYFLKGWAEWPIIHDGVSMFLNGCFETNRCLSWLICQLTWNIWNTYITLYVFIN